MPGEDKGGRKQSRASAGVASVSEERLSQDWLWAQLDFRGPVLSLRC